MSLKVLVTVPGHLRTVPMNRYVPETLSRMGHEVVLYDYEPRGLYPLLLKKADRDRWVRHIDRGLLRLAEKTRPDALLAIYGLDHSRDTLEKIRAMGITTVCWWLNDPFQFERSAARAGLFDHYFTNSRGSLAGYRGQGLTNVHYLPVGIYPPVHKRLPGEPKEYEVSFAGDWSPVREEVLSALVSDFDLSIFGPWKLKLGKGSPLSGRVRGGKFFSPEEMVRIFNRSKVVLNVHSWFGKTSYGVNPRLFEANGCGAFQVCDWKDEIPDLYEDGKEIILYNNIEQLKGKIAYYLSHEPERAGIAERAYLRSHAEHTYERRLTEMLKVILSQERG